METLKDLKTIRDNAPEGATEFTTRFGKYEYYKFSIHGCWYYFEGNNWVPIERPQIVSRSLSDINRIIELLETNKRLFNKLTNT